MYSFLPAGTVARMVGRAAAQSSLQILRMNQMKMLIVIPQTIYDPYLSSVVGWLHLGSVILDQMSISSPWGFLLNKAILCWPCTCTPCISTRQLSYFKGCWHFLPGFLAVCHNLSCTSFFCVGANRSFISKESIRDSSEDSVETALRAAEACDIREITRSRTSGSLVSSTDLWISWR